jgi:hypothetical protein
MVSGIPDQDIKGGFLTNKPINGNRSCSVIEYTLFIEVLTISSSHTRQTLNTIRDLECDPQMAHLESPSMTSCLYLIVFLNVSCTI